ncbi:Rbk1p [Sugiyamaella lignohabitans]|uniref:Ribokinase n=1 Tax=Sugiyamaella lignohabitans TaxID=796027 RepID=A0A167DCQ4_9ASCO|nr:Rbk1p [Sugiyamaella lignohabitans]ANB12766.1 Rbk1p [Sugiyamaella lignohabitans]
MRDIVVFGSINYDLVTTSKRVPASGETIAASGFKTFHGGKGANQARALRRLSDKNEITVRMIGRVGNDVFGEELLSGLEKEGIDVSRVEKIKNEPTGTATIIVDEALGENRILVYPGANGTFKVTEETVWDEIRKANFLVLQNEIPVDVVFKAIQVAHDAHITVIYNPSPMTEIPHEILSKVDLLVLNSTEANAILPDSVATIDDDVDRALIAMKKLQQKLESTSIIITLGANGSIFSSPGASPQTFSAAKADKIVDTTGAGDTFLGAFVSKWSKDPRDHNIIPEAISFASAASALAVARPGAADGIPYLREL